MKAAAGSNQEGRQKAIAELEAEKETIYGELRSSFGDEEAK